MTTSLQLWQPVRYDRNDRRVQRARMRLPAGTSEHRVTFLIEEALRLMAMPGEDQGRTYYFRRVALRGVPAGAPLVEWIDLTQATMQALAQQALHGKDPRSATAYAVFFNSQQEALEWLLDRLLHSRGANFESAEWFAPMISNAPQASIATAQIVAIVECLRSLPAGWFAAATALLSSIEAHSEAASLIASLPERTIQLWLNELGSAQASGSAVPRLTARRLRFLLDYFAKNHGYAATPLHMASVEAQRTAASSSQTASHRPAHDLPPCLIWLAALAIIAEDPAALARGSAISHARALLRQLAQPFDRLLEKQDRERDESLERVKAKTDFAPAAKPTELRERSSTGDPLQIAEDLSIYLPYAELDTEFDGSLPTDAAGLYFLLNALRHLGIADAIEQLPPHVRSAFLARLVASLAQVASVFSDDPALARSATGPDAGDAEFHIAVAPCWPRSFFQPPETHHSLALLVRVWTLAVRRWCWLMGRLTLREIVCRPGYVLLSRTDLDVTLSMDTVDLRLRRLGLDLDPGWLPWFGRVVRFHYTGSNARVGTGGATA